MSEQLGIQPNLYRSALRAMRRTFVLVGLFSAIINLLMLTGSLYMLQVYDRVLSSGSVPTLLGLFAVVVVLYAFLGLYEFVRSRLLSRASYQLDNAIGSEAFRVWLRANLPGEPRRAEGHPLQDLEVVRNFIASPAILGLYDTPWIPFYLAIVFFIHPWLGVLTISGAVIVALAAFLNRFLTQEAISRSMSTEASERGFSENGRRNAEVIQALGMQGRIIEKWRQMHRARLGMGQVGGDISEMVSAFSKAFRLLLQSAMLTLAAYLVLQQEITAGMIIASSIIAGRALAPVDQVIGQWRMIARSGEAHKRLQAFFDDRQTERPRINLPAPTGILSVSKLTKLAPGNAPKKERARILDGVSFQLQPGDGLGVIGNSAAGKSTLARLLVGAWRADSGEIRLDGATQEQWDPIDLGRSIGYLPQSLDMLPGTIRDNIARFDPSADDVVVIEAARLAGVHEMILRLPDGYATYVGGSDQPLSGGQIQRVGLARALYGNPKIIVLDEPNSNMDVGGDDALCAAILKMRSLGSVVIVMAHRPSAIAAVNKLMVLHQGKLAQFGEKAEVLLAAGGKGAPSSSSVPMSAPGPQPKPSKPAPMMQPTTDPSVTSPPSPEPEGVNDDKKSNSAQFQSRRR